MTFYSARLQGRLPPRRKKYGTLLLPSYLNTNEYTQKPRARREQVSQTPEHEDGPVSASGLLSIRVSDFVFSHAPTPTTRARTPFSAAVEGTLRSYDCPVPF